MTAIRIEGTFEVETIARARNVPGKDAVDYVHVHGMLVYRGDDNIHEPADLSFFLPKTPDGDSPVRIGQTFRVTIEGT